MRACGLHCIVNDALGIVQASPDKGSVDGQLHVMKVHLVPATGKCGRITLAAPIDFNFKMYLFKMPFSINSMKRAESACIAL